MAALTVSLVRTAAEMEQAIAIRRAVFIEEQHVPESLEIDRYDDDPASVIDAIHVLALTERRPVATGRLLLDARPGENAHIGRVAVLREERGRGYGTAVVDALHDEARRRGFPGITIAAQTHAISFYERLGYVAYGDVFLDAGIEHRWMDIPL